MYDMPSATNLRSFCTSESVMSLSLTMQSPIHTPLSWSPPFASGVLLSKKLLSNTAVTTNCCSFPQTVMLQDQTTGAAGIAHAGIHLGSRNSNEGGARPVVQFVIAGVLVLLYTRHVSVKKPQSTGREREKRRPHNSGSCSQGGTMIVSLVKMASPLLCVFQSYRRSRQR